MGREQVERPVVHGGQHFGRGRRLLLAVLAGDRDPPRLAISGTELVPEGREGDGERAVVPGHEHGRGLMDELVIADEGERHAESAAVLLGDGQLEDVRDQIWKFYEQLKAYRAAPCETHRTQLAAEFDRLFQQRTGYQALNDALALLYAKRDGLLAVLEHPHLPLHNNLSETDIREYARLRKVSGGTRSDLGRRCRDTFLSLKKTCRKLGLSFWQFLKDRLSGAATIPPLPNLMRQAAAAH